VTSPTRQVPAALDFTAAARWPVRAAAHVLGAGLVLAVIAALPVAPTDLDRHQLPKETVVHLVTWVAVLLARPFPLPGLRPAARWSLAALVGITIVSGVMASDGWLALRAGSLLITGVVAFVTARHLAAAGAGSILLAWCGVAGVAGATAGLAQAYGVHSLLFAATRIPGGTFGNRNFMAHFSGLALPVLMLVAVSARRQLVAVAVSLACAVLVAAIVLSRSRAAWIGAGAGTLLFLAVCLGARRRHALPAIGTRGLVLGGVMTAGVIAAMAIPNHLAWRSASPYLDTFTALANHDEGSGHGRVLQYRNTVRLALQHPVLGVGPGNWPVRYGEVAPPNDPTWVFGDVVPINPWPSSDWMALVSELGVLALLAALLLGVAIAWRGLAAARSSGDRVLGGATLLALLTVTFIEGNLDAVLLLPAPLLFVALSAGAVLQRSDDTPEADAIPSGAPSRGAILLPLVLGVITLRSATQTAAYAVAGSGRSLARLAWAARVDPGSYPIRIALAQRESCPDAKNDIIAAIRMAPTWPATINAARRCGVRIQR
jgi:O-antigen ligase